MPAPAEKPAATTNGIPRSEALPDATALKDKTPECFRTSSASCVFLVGLVIILVLFFGSAPLWHSDLWDHINYGQRIIDTGSIPATEPLLPLAEGMPMVNTAWGAQVGMAAIYANERLGLPGLQFVNGLLVVIALGTVGWAIRRLSGSVVFGMLGYVVFLIVNWQQFLVFRPQLIGVTFFSILLAVLAINGTRRRYAWFALPIMFAAWANLHGSFAMGLALLGLFTVGRFLDIALRTRSLRLAIRSRSAWQLVLLLQLCSAAVLLNPNGLATYSEVLRVGGHPNISTMYEWDPLTLRMKQGKAAAVVAALLLLTLRLSPRRLRAEHMLALLATGGLALWSARMINWFAPVTALVLAIHAAAVWRMLLKRRRSIQPPVYRGYWTLVSLGLCWICFGFTTLGVQTIHGKPLDPQHSLSRATPIQVGRYLSEDAVIPAGVAFMPAEWAGYLANVCGQKLRPMANIHVHVIPEEVWISYVWLLDGPDEWQSLFDRFGINYAVAQKGRNNRLIRHLRNSSDYALQYEDAQTAVFARTEPIR